MSRLSMNTARWRKLCPLVLDRDGYQCTACGSTEDLTVDHLKPLAQFTPEDWTAELQYDETNLTTLCRQCNGRKRDKVAAARSTWFDRRWLDNV